MFIKNEKGFTLVEILAVVAILGILATIGIFIATGIQDKVKKQYYLSQENFIMLAGKDYFSTNRGLLPTPKTPESSVKLSVLVNDEYIDPVYNYKKILCNQDDKSYVQAIYVKPGVYSYAVYLTCPDYKSDDTWYWSGWQKEQPVNVAYESQQRYNYRLSTKNYTAWKADDGKDETQTNPEYVERQVSGSQMFQYRDQQWKWYKKDYYSTIPQMYQPYGYEKDLLSLTYGPWDSWTENDYNCNLMFQYFDCEIKTLTRYRSPLYYWEQTVDCSPPEATAPFSCPINTGRYTYGQWQTFAPFMGQYETKSTTTYTCCPNDCTNMWACVCSYQQPYCMYGTYAADSKVNYEYRSILYYWQRKERTPSPTTDPPGFIGWTNVGFGGYSPWSEWSEFYAGSPLNAEFETSFRYRSRAKNYLWYRYLYSDYSSVQPGDYATKDYEQSRYTDWIDSVTEPEKFSYREIRSIDNRQVRYGYYTFGNLSLSSFTSDVTELLQKINANTSKNFTSIEEVQNSTNSDGKKDIDLQQETWYRYKIYKTKK